MIDVKKIAEDIKKQIQALQVGAEQNANYYRGAMDGVQKLMDELDSAVKKEQDAEAATGKEKQPAGE